MDRAADMNPALAFVINRIEEQAMRLGQPLDEEQRSLLNNLPDQSDVPEFSTGDPEFPVHFRLRDVTYERLCALAKAAYRTDREMDPRSQEWEFAFNVSKLNRHPMAWLLQWAGVKQRRPWWDGWLLVAAALLFTCSYCSRDAPRCRRRESVVAVGNCRRWLHRPRAFHAHCFPANRRTAVGAKHRETQRCLPLCWHPYVMKLA